MKTLERQESDNEFHRVGNLVREKLNSSIENHYDIFFDLLSQTTWQSPKELVTS